MSPTSNSTPSAASPTPSPASTAAPSPAASPRSSDALKTSLGDAGNHFKQAARDGSDAMRGAAGAAGEELKRGRERVQSDISDGARDGRAAAEQIGSAASEQVDELMDRGRDLLDSAAELVRERPLASFGTAFAAGWIISRLARSSNR